MTTIALDPTTGPRTSNTRTTSTTETADTTDAADNLLVFPASATFRAPARFDAHEVDGFHAWTAERIAAGTRHVVIDCSAIRFADLSAVEAIDAARDVVDGRLELVELSTAMTITLELLAGRPADVLAAA